MEVISGMEVISSLAPRPSTPVMNPSGGAAKKRPGNNNNARGSVSAPSSPARAGASACFPLINRLPSQDSMDRSIHNESTHGKSASQIIRELKQSNSAMSAKTASMEADFMNQLNHQNRKSEEQKKRMEETLKKSEKLLAVLEGRCITAEQTVKEREQQLAKLREEGAFQRHTISDLKNQLHHMELEQEDAAYEKRDEVDKWQVEKQRMEQDMEDLRAQVQDSQVLQQEVERLNHKLEDFKISSGHSGVHGDDESINSHLGSSQRSSYTNRSFMKQSLPQTRDTLKKTKHRLSVTEAALDILKQERARMMHEHQHEVEQMQQHMQALEQSHFEREEALQQTVQNMGKQQQSPFDQLDSSIDSPNENAAVIELKVELQEANQTIDQLEGQLHQCQEQVNELTTKLQKLRADAENQEQYRADEAEDLRVLHDAQEEEIERLRKELDGVNRELELRDQELEEQKVALTTVAKQEGQSEPPSSELGESIEETPARQNKNSAPTSDVADPAIVADLSLRLHSSEAAIERLETELDTTRKEHHDRVEHLERVLHEVTEGKDLAEEQLAQLSAVLVLETTAGSSMAPGSMEGSEGTPLLEQDGITAADLTTMLRNVEQLQENERKAISRVKELEYLQTELEDLRNSRQSETEELEELVARLKESEEKLASTRDGAMEEYRMEIQKLRGQLKAKDSARALKLDEHLREAQASLSDVQNEKVALAEEYLAKINHLEEDKGSIQKEMELLKDEKKTMIKSHLNTLQQIQQDKAVLTNDFEARIKSCENKISELKDCLQHVTEERDTSQRQNQEIQQEITKLTQSHSESLQESKQERAKMEVDFTEQLQEKEAELSHFRNNTSSSSTGEPTPDSDQLTMLKQEIEKLQKQLLEEQVMQQHTDPSLETRGNQSRGALEADLRKMSETTQREKDEEAQALREKLEDRDTTISALVKSSVGLEQKISKLTKDLQIIRSEQSASSTSCSVSAGANEDAQDEVLELREALADYKEVETRLIHELSLTKKQLKFAESEISRLQEVMEEEVSCDSAHLRRQIQERDDAVSALVGQSMAREAEMKKLTDKLQVNSQELESMRAEKQKTAVQLRAELRRLHQESEIFAGQIIEQDEELEALRAEIHNRDEKIAALNMQVTASRGPNYCPGMMNPNGESPEVVSLNAQIDELEEANETYRSELRELRFKLQDYDSIRNELALVKFELEEVELKSEEMAGSKGDLLSEIAARQKVEQRLEELLASNKDNNQACDLLARERDALVGQRDKVIDELRRNIDGCTCQIEALETEIDTLHGELKQKVIALEDCEERIVELETKATDFSRSLASRHSQDKNVALFEEVEDLQQQVRDLEVENQKLFSFKEKMTEVETVQHNSSKMAEAYERKLHLITLDKDTTIDSLQKSLMEIRGQAEEDFEAMTRELKKHDLENRTLRQEMKGVLEEKDNKIFALEHTLDAQEQLVGSMKTEMDHLQGSMVNTAYSRKEEIEDMEKEVLDLTTKNAAFEREITSLKIQLEDNKLAHMTEVAKLRETVDRLSFDASAGSVQKSPIDNFPIHEVKERLEKLRWRNNSIQEENFKLKSRLEKAEAEIQTARNEKYKTAKLEAQVGSLMKQLKTNDAALKNSETMLASLTLSDKAEAPPPIAKMAPPESPHRSSSRPPSRAGSRSSTPSRFSRQGTPQRQQQAPEPPSTLRQGSKPRSRQSTPQRKRTPLTPRPNAQKQQDPDTPNTRKRTFFGFKRKSDRENNGDQPSRPQYLQPPCSSVPKNERILKPSKSFPESSAKSVQSAKTAA